MPDFPEDKQITLATDYENSTINMEFSENLTDAGEIGYILSSSFFSFCVDQGLSKEDLLDMVEEHYDEFLHTDE